MLSIFRRKQLVQDWNKAAEAIERAALEKTLRDVGICRYSGRLQSGCFANETLARDVMNDFFAEAAKEPLMTTVLKAVFA